MLQCLDENQPPQSEMRNVSVIFVNVHGLKLEVSSDDGDPLKEVPRSKVKKVCPVCVFFFFIFFFFHLCDCLSECETTNVCVCVCVCVCQPSFLSVCLTDCLSAGELLVTIDATAPNDHSLRPPSLSSLLLALL